MLKDGFLRFCDDPEIACCKAEAELGRLRNENARLLSQLQDAQRRADAAVEDILHLIKCADDPYDLCPEVCANNDGICMKGAIAGFTDKCHGFEWRGVAEGEKV